ncbi:PD-(D/E)XK nuclease family protein [Kaistella flava (ex Peng et al. 2021)]|nr:PD-(D/E)XK nuclease family protein [Kaistella flava (ex Peng et al. 2021)]
MTQITAPNIFKYATKELSQDAFLCWLFSFAAKKYDNSEFKQLHLLSLDILYQFIGDGKIDIREIEVKKQVHKIDIWIEINSNILIIIEDKTNSAAGKGQLEKYYDIATEYCNSNNFNDPICIYFKTGNEAKNVFSKSNVNGKWKYFSLEDLHKILHIYQKQIIHPYFQDFYQLNFERLQVKLEFEKYISKENQNGFRNDIIEAFYTRLEQDEVFTNWNYNDSIGNRTYYSNDYVFDSQKTNVYLQFDRLDLKLKVDLNKLREEKGPSYKKFQKELKKNNIELIYNDLRHLFLEDPKLKEKIIRPKKRATHNFLTFAVIPIDQWLFFNSDGKMNYKKSKDNIVKINKDLKVFTTSNQDRISAIVEAGFIK